VSFTKEVHDWEVNVFASFFQILHLVIVKRGSEDKLWWVPSKKCLFKVKIFSSFFQILHSIIVKRGCEDKLWCQDFFFTLFHSLTRRIGTRFPWKYVWRTQAPSRAAFFSWSATLGKIPTLDNLRKRHVIMINKCYMCKKTEEFVNHFLLHCDVAFALWYSLFCRFGLS